MLRINLLPGYVAQRRITKNLTILFVVIFLACLLTPLLIYTSAKGTLSEALHRAEDAETKQKVVQGLRSEADSTRAQIAPIQARVDFVKAVHAYTLSIVRFWNTVAAYSDKRVIYSDAVVSGNTLTIKAYTPSIEVVGRYLQVMYHEPDFQTVGIDRLPGYPEALVNKYYLEGQLIAIGSSSASGGGGGGGYPGGGGGGGYPGGASSASSSGGYPGGGYPGGGGGGGAAGPSFGTPVPIGPTGPTRSVVQVPVISEGGSGNTATVSGTLDAQALYTALSTTPQFSRLVNTNVNPFIPQQQRVNEVIQILQRRVRVRREPQGFAITVTATLKQPLMAPTLPGAAPAGAAGGGGYPGAGGGGYPGGGGGYPGGGGGYPR